jgi:hypothetical protein
MSGRGGVLGGVRRALEVLMELLKPFLLCQHCDHKISLPHPNPQGKPSAQIEWPPDTWKRNFLCQRCAHVYVYSGFHVHWEPSLEPTQSQQSQSLVAVCFEIPCAMQDCQVPLKVHAVVDAWPLPSILGRRLIVCLGRRLFHSISCDFGYGPCDPLERGLTQNEASLDTVWFEE